MKTNIIWILSILLLFLGIQSTISQTTYNIGGHDIFLNNGNYFKITNNDTIPIKTDKIVVRFKESITESEKNNFTVAHGLTFLNATKLGISVYSINASTDFLNLIANLSTDARIKYYDMNFLMSYFSNQPPNNDISESIWGLNETVMWPYENTQLYDAWNITHGSPEIVVANLDNGIVLDHEDLGKGNDTYSNIWVNKNEIPGNNIDDDDNLYIDDCNGWNFGVINDYHGNNDVTHNDPLYYRHGTMTTGIISAKTNNELGVFGIAGGWNGEGVKTMMVKTANANDYPESAQIPLAIQYAVENGARIINMAWGVSTNIQSIEDEIENHYTAGSVTFLAGVGNDNSNYIPFPASSHYVIAVGATEYQEESVEKRWINNSKRKGSNYGDSLEIMTPGSPMIISRQPIFVGEYTYETQDEDEYYYSTSSAVSFASGVVALMLSANPCLTNDEIRAILRNTNDRITGGFEFYNYDNYPDRPGFCLYMGYGRINAKKAIEECIIGTPITITEPVSPWVTDQTLYYDLTIEAGGILNITGCNISVFPEAKIIVKPGGKLIIENATIKGICEHTWQGIEVWGNSTAHQWPNMNGNYAQGYIEINNSTIENAICALDLWKPGDYTKTGGIVIATNSGFINNTKSVHALHYQNSHPVSGKPMDYQAIFTKCTFNITDAYNPVYTFFKHVDLNQVNGVRFYGCDFSLSPEAQGVSDYNHAIASYSSGFKVNAICISPINPCDEYDHSTFTGFYSAIYAGNGSNLSYTFSVNRADFTGNSTGIEVNSVTNQSVLFCNFNLGFNKGDAGSCATGAPSFGIDMVGSNSFIIEENTFNKNEGAPQGLYVGIKCKDSKTPFDVIYRNSFNGLSYGNYAQGLNRERPGEDHNGLQFMCNTNQNNAVDFIVAKKDALDNPMIHGSQGSLKLEAGNTFSTNPLEEGNFKNEGRQYVNYFYNTNPPIYFTPIYVVPIPVTTTNGCPSNYGGINPKTIVLNESQKLHSELDFATNLSDYNNVKLLFDNLKDGGSTAGLKMEVTSSWPEDMWELRAKLLGDSPHLSEEVLKAAADKTDVLPESVLFEILSANPDELRKESLIEYLENKTQPLPEYMISILKQLAGGITYKTALMQDMAGYEAEKTKAANDLIRSCLNDTYIDMEYLRNWYDNLNTLNADYGIVSSYLTEKNYSAATTMLDIIPVVRNLEGNDLVEFAEYKELMLWQIQLMQQGGDVTSIGDVSINMLFETAESGTGRASLLARTMLEYGQGYHFDKCLPIVDQASYKSGNLISNLHENGLTITANPNPANTWVTFDYGLPVTANGAELIVSDMQGKLVVSFRLAGPTGQQVWDTRPVEKGIYVYTLKAGGICKQGKLVIQ